MWLIGFTDTLNICLRLSYGMILHPHDELCAAVRAMTKVRIKNRPHQPENYTPALSH
jgi:hypothetical protein